MSEAPERIWVLQSDLDHLITLNDGRADSVIASATPMHNMHGEPVTVEYVRADLYEQLEQERDEARKQAEEYRDEIKYANVDWAFPWEATTPEEDGMSDAEWPPVPYVIEGETDLARAMRYWDQIIKDAKRIDQLERSLTAIANL